MSIRSISKALSLAAALSTGCGNTSSSEPPPAPETVLPVTLDGAIVAIPREVSPELRQQVAQRLEGVVDNAGTSFYLALRRSELSQKWFLSAFSKQHHPGGVIFSAGTSLGTRVVSFKEQNGKLFVLDVDDRKVMSDVFDPQVLVEAYPIVKDHGPFNRMPGSGQYVLIDPAAGLNRFGVMGDVRAAEGVHFQVELSFAQRFRRIADGVTFEQVYTGYANLPNDWAPDLAEPNPFRASGTLGLALRRYAEGPGYTPTPLPPLEHYFRSEPKLIPNTGGLTEQVAAKWNIHPGMKPIRWYITDDILTVQQDPRYQGYDLVGAMKRGIEGWNTVFGFPVLEAHVGDSTLSYADDDKNVVILDPDEAIPFAFAQWRTNPNTGEIRGANIYFSASFMWFADLEYVDDEAREAHKPPPPLRMTWSGMRSEPLCELQATAGLQAAGGALTKKEKVERFLTHNMMHEIGHTLGLRHNFAGSRVYDGSPASPVSSSVMEYVETQDAVHRDTPGTYDVQAIRYLYGLSSQLPTEAFCTDKDTSTDVYCNQYDRFDEPLTKWYVPALHASQASMLNSTRPLERLASTFSFNTNPVLQFVRAGTPAVQAQAYSLALQKLRPPLVIPPGARADYAARADELARRTLARLYLDPAANRGRFTANPPATPALMALVHADLRAILLNMDGVRSYAARRTMVDILKEEQSLAAYTLLDEVRGELTATLPSLPAGERLQTADLVARITAALSPYYR